MNKSAAHQLKTGWRKFFVLCGTIMFLLSPSSLPAHHLSANVTLVFAAVSAPFVEFGWLETRDIKAALAPMVRKKGQLFDDDDHRTSTPVITPAVTSTPGNGHENTATATAPEQTQTPVQASPTGTPVPTDTSLPVRRHPSVTPGLWRFGPVFPQSTRSGSATPQATFTPVPSAVPSSTAVPTSTPDPAAGGGIVRNLIPQAPLVREVLPFELPLAIVTAALLLLIYAVWLKTR